MRFKSNYWLKLHTYEHWIIKAGSLTPSKVLPLFDITEYKACVAALKTPHVCEKLNVFVAFLSTQWIQIVKSETQNK